MKHFEAFGCVELKTVNKILVLALVFRYFDLETQKIDKIPKFSTQNIYRKYGMWVL